MLQLIEMRRSDIAELCRRFHVNRLEVFGSAARGSDFDPARSDVDLLVTYFLATNPGSRPIRTSATPWKICSAGRSIWSWKQPWRTHSSGPA
jgi:predicted nucleotidyltransferase